MSTINSDQLHDEVRERIENGIEYVAVVKFDDERLARVSSYTFEGLQEELYKLERAELARIEQEYNERIDDMAYMRDVENDILATYNGDY